ncbi:MAG: dienelactone hydrolase family protein [Planctomycetes bacterium]|nr:dienelactone hydrolase family protein [Planctomycetota bacterium]
MNKAILSLLIGGVLAPPALAFQKPTDFSVKTDDNYEIHGEILIPKKAKDAKSPLAIFVHDAKGRRSQFSDAQMKFFKSGYAAVIFDLRGHNQSSKFEGREIDLSKDDPWKLMRRDLSAVIGYCKEQKDVDTDRIVLIGAGFGATLALKFATIDETVKGVVCLSCPLSAPYSKDDSSKFVEKLSVKSIPMLLYTGKTDDDKKAAKDIKFYADKANASGKFEVKNLPIDAKSGELLAQKPSLADEFVAWFKKNAFDPTKDPAKEPAKEPPKK